MGRQPTARGGLQLRAWPRAYPCQHAARRLPRHPPGQARGQALQCDGYAAYKKVAGSKSTGTSVTLAFCWSHVRRGFYDLAKAKAPIATEALQRIAALYEIAARVRGKSAADRLAVRQAESKPLVAKLRVWFEAQIAKLPPAAQLPTRSAMR